MTGKFAAIVWRGVVTYASVAVGMRPTRFTRGTSVNGAKVPVSYYRVVYGRYFSHKLWEFTTYHQAVEYLAGRSGMFHSMFQNARIQQKVGLRWKDLDRD